MKESNTRKKKVWQKTPTPYLFRHIPSGTFYLRARMGGKKEAHRQSLGVKDYQIARARLDDEMLKLRLRAPLRAGEIPETLWDAMKVVRAQIQANPALKERSKAAYEDVIKSMEPGKEKSGLPTTPLTKLTKDEVEAWWKKTATNYAPARANFQLLCFRRATKLAKEMGGCLRDYGKELELMHVPRTRLNLITSEQFAQVIATVRANTANVYAAAAADWFEFVAYTGTRPEEANAVRWSHVDEARKIVTITGGPTGTKNREVRPVPITEQLADLLRRIKERKGDDIGEFVLTAKDYCKTLHQACDTLKIVPRLRRYDLRHLFATRCNEAGVDVPTFAKWLGHKDGGALAMKTYVHPHYDHEQQAAAKVKF